MKKLQGSDRSTYKKPATMKERHLGLLNEEKKERRKRNEEERKKGQREEGGRDGWKKRE